jgi:hypothetical protein
MQILLYSQPQPQNLPWTFSFDWNYQEFKKGEETTASWFHTTVRWPNYYTIIEAAKTCQLRLTAMACANAALMHQQSNMS